MHKNFKLYTADMAKDIAKAIKESNFNPNVKGSGDFEVVMTIERIDRDGEIVKIEGGDITNYIKNPVVLWGHNYYELPIGAVTEIRKEGDKMIAKGVFANTYQGQEARKLYDDGILKTVSIGFIPKERSNDGQTITKWELLELSFVPVPANADALSTLSKSQKESLQKLCKMFEPKDQSTKTVVASHDPEKAPEDAEFSAETAIENLKAWAQNEDGETDSEKYQQGFAYYENDDYKLVHHDVIDGKLVTVWRGVAASMADLLSEDGAGIPEGDREGVYKHLADHYKQFDKEAPEYGKSYTADELAKMAGEPEPEATDTIKGQINSIMGTLEGDLNALLAGAVQQIKELTGVSLAQSIIKQEPKTDTKSGRVLSGKNRKKIENAVEVLQDLLDSSEEPKGNPEMIIKQAQNIDKMIEKLIIEAKKQQ